MRRSRTEYKSPVRSSMSSCSCYIYSYRQQNIPSAILSKYQLTTHHVQAGTSTSLPFGGVPLTVTPLRSPSLSSLHWRHVIWRRLDTIHLSHGKAPCSEVGDSCLVERARDDVPIDFLTIRMRLVLPTCLRGDALGRWMSASVLIQTSRFTSEHVFVIN